MDIKLYSLLHGDLSGNYTLTYSGKHVTIDNVVSLVQQAKRKYNIRGKYFIVVTPQQLFYVTKLKNNKWKGYQLSDE